MEVADADDLGGHPDQLLLAAAVRRELGTGLVFSRAARHARMGLSRALFDGGAIMRILSDPSGAPMGDEEMESCGETPFSLNRPDAALKRRACSIVGGQPKRKAS
jgi:hypothetical protein